MFYFFVVDLKMPEREFWFSTPRRIQSILNLHAECNKLKNNIADGKDDSKTDSRGFKKVKEHREGFIDQLF